MELSYIVYLLNICTLTALGIVDKPNIVFIIADDLGWNDVSFHGSDQIMTPNIDLLAYSGVALGRYYSHAICTPCRSALLTGKYAHRLGMQGMPLYMSEDRGIPISETLLPEYLKKAGYATHLVGKWHVGSSRKEYLPTSRGFESHFGHRGGYVDYYDYTVEETFSSIGTVSGLPLYRNLTPAWDVEGYITDVYSNHAVSLIEQHDTSSPLFLMVAHNAPHSANNVALLQAPPEVVREMRHVELTSRRMFAAMVKKLDDSIGDIVKALYKKGIINNTIIAFISDNGGMTSGEYHNYASNYPLRGLKMTPFEGGVRVVGLLWSASLCNTDHHWDGYMHVTDWMPTLLHAAGIEIPPNLNGINQWESIHSNSRSERHIMYEIDDYTGYGSIIFGNYKLVTGNINRDYGTYQGSDLRGIIGKVPSYKDAIADSTAYSIFKLLGRQLEEVDLSMRKNTVIECNSSTSTVCFPDNGRFCLYNIIEDPCETTDISAVYPELVKTLNVLLEEETARRIPRKLSTYRDPLSAPSRNNYTWNTWLPDSRLSSPILATNN